MVFFMLFIADTLQVGQFGEIVTEVLVGLPQIQHHAIATDVIIICNLEIHIWL
jgi:hypothetical protein